MLNNSDGILLAPVNQARDPNLGEGLLRGRKASTSTFAAEIRLLLKLPDVTFPARTLLPASSLD